MTAVNDAPSFTLPASPNQSVPQDAGAQTVVGFATNITAGPANESGQTLTFNVSNTNTGLFSAQPDIDEATGTLTYTPAAGQSGSATVSVFLTDDGTPPAQSATQTFTITVVPPNTAPVAVDQTGGNAVAVTEDVAVTITLTATDADDDDLTFSIVASPTKGSLGTIGTPDCTTIPNTCTATVTYTPTADANGADSFTFRANDGQADSNTATVELNIAPVNDAPSFTKGADQTVLEDSGAQTRERLGDRDQRRARRRVGPDGHLHRSRTTRTRRCSRRSRRSPGRDADLHAGADAFGIATITLGAATTGQRRRRRARRRPSRSPSRR